MTLGRKLYIFGTETRYVSEIEEILRSLDLRFKHWPYPAADVFQSPGSYLLAAGSPSGREELSATASDLGLSAFDAVVHATSSVSTFSSLGSGTTINRLVAIGANSVIGDHVQINRSASIGHDVRVGSFVSVGPGVTITSEVEVFPLATIGAGAVILPGLKIGESATVGAGAVVTKNVEPGAVVLGNPAKQI